MHAEPASQYITLGELTLHLACAGPPDGPLLLFLHGFPEFWGCWQNQLSFFAAAGYYTVAPDMRGYNRSDKPAGVDNYQVKYLVEDLFLLARQLGRRSFTLAGHDWGGVVAWAFALSHPNHLDKLIIINAPHPAVFARELLHNPAQQAASRYIPILRSRRAESILQADGYAKLANMIIAQCSRALTEAELQAYREAWSQDGALTGSLNYYRAMRWERGELETIYHQSVTSPLAYRVNTPTLVIWGEQDRALLPGNLDGLDAFVPDLTIRRIPDAGHWIVREKPALINKLIHHFISQQVA